MIEISRKTPRECARSVLGVVNSLDIWWVSETVNCWSIFAKPQIATILSKEKSFQFGWLMAFKTIYTRYQWQYQNDTQYSHRRHRRQHFITTGYDQLKYFPTGLETMLIKNSNWISSLIELARIATIEFIFEFENRSCFNVNF